jgi:hypothetical protein
MFRKPYVSKRDFNSLFNIFEKLFALAIHNDVFAADLKDVECVNPIKIRLL